MAAATPRTPIDWTWNVRAASRGSTSPPLELQLLPPAPFAATESPWGVDPSRLQQLMMGSATSSGSVALSASCSTARDLGTLFDDQGGSVRPLPSGWERCLDLQSGEVFLKKCDTSTRDLPSVIHPHPEQGKQIGTGSSGGPEASSQTDEPRQDWSHRWLRSDITRTSHREAAISRKSSLGVPTRLGGDEDTSSSPDGEPLCLDLKLNSEKRSRLSIEAQGPTFLQASNGIAHDLFCTGRFARDLVQQRKWQQCANGQEEPTTNIQEMAREPTMVTAVCSKCLMFVLLRKSNPVCPRCSVPVNLDGALMSSVNNGRRPLLELSSDDLSLSTESSR